MHARTVSQLRDRAVAFTYREDLRCFVGRPVGGSEYDARAIGEPLGMGLVNLGIIGRSGGQEGDRDVRDIVHNHALFGVDCARRGLAGRIGRKQERCSDNPACFFDTNCHRGAPYLNQFLPIILRISGSQKQIFALMKIFLHTKFHSIDPEGHTANAQPVIFRHLAPPRPCTFGG